MCCPIPCGPKSVFFLRAAPLRKRAAPRHPTAGKMQLPELSRFSGLICPLFCFSVVPPETVAPLRRFSVLAPVADLVLCDRRRTAALPRGTVLSSRGHPSTVVALRLDPLPLANRRLHEFCGNRSNMIFVQAGTLLLEVGSAH